jgi:hypothetical protein
LERNEKKKQTKRTNFRRVVKTHTRNNNREESWSPFSPWSVEKGPQECVGSLITEKYITSRRKIRKSELVAKELA